MKLYFLPGISFLFLLFHLSFSIPAIAQQHPVFFGMQNEGGTHVSGTISRFDPITNKDTVVWNFGAPGDGQNATGDLVYDAYRKVFYGMNTQGGKYSAGTIFSFDPVTLEDSILWDLGNGTDGQFPWASLVFCPANGLYYGTTDMGGADGSGAIISFNPANDSEHVVWSFFGGKNDGQYPVGNLTYDTTNGLFYLMTNYGGIKDLGVIASFDPLTNSENVLWSFGISPDGSQPYGSLTYCPANGLLYGMTSAGGRNACGAIISFDPTTGEENIPYNFNVGPDGRGPWGSLVYDAASGLMLGMTAYGGSLGLGILFSFNPLNNAEIVLWNFGNGTDGQHPYASLTYYPNNGLYYAMLSAGGPIGEGAIISFNTKTNRDSVLYSFHSFSTDGYQPMNSLTLYDPNAVSGIKTITSSLPVSVYPNPANGLFNISGLHYGQKVEVYNCAGQKLNSLITENATEQLNISAYVNGMYMLRILNVDGSHAEQKKVVKTE